jgi:hypothetical protein
MALLLLILLIELRSGLNIAWVLLQLLEYVLGLCVGVWLDLLHLLLV